MKVGDKVKVVKEIKGFTEFYNLIGEISNIDYSVEHEYLVSFEESDLAFKQNELEIVQEV
jgi:hypothetical protein